MIFLKKKMHVKNIIAQSFHEKEIKNSADNRKSLLIIKNWFCSKIITHYTAYHVFLEQIVDL